MLLRGQNLLGYRHYEDSVVDRFVEKAAENGMDVFRVFDALNDIRNLRRSVAAVRRTGKHAQGTICYTVSPLHTITRFRRDGRAAARPGLRFHLHQGHGRPAEAATGLRHRQGHQGNLRAGRARPRARACHHRRHHGQPDEGHRSRRGLRGYGHQLAQPRPGPQSHRKPGGDAGRHRLRPPGWTSSGCSRSSTISTTSGRATRSFSPTSPASKPRSSTARFPAA